jgi:histidinol-phosphate aminotransferase
LLGELGFDNGVSRKETNNLNLITAMIKSTVNRRTWLKRSALAAGGVMSGIALAPQLFGKPAFGMTPLYEPSLLEMYDAFAQDTEIKVRLNANENPFGPSKKAIAAIAEAASKGNRYVYGNGPAKKFLEMIAEKEGVTAGQVLLAAGSTDILEKVAFATCLKGGNVISADPSYLSLVKTAQAIGATWKNIPLRADYAHDLDAMEKAIDADTKIIYICNPNNPTATLTPVEEIKAFIKKVNNRALVYIDEAYLELLPDPAGQTAVGMVSSGFDVIVSRTFSKIHGMAGMRMGYMVARPERIKMIQKLVRTEMGVSVASLEGAMASFKDIEFQEYSRAHIKEGREFVFAELKKAGLNPVPSVTNFVLFSSPMPTKDLVEKMKEKSVAIRGFDIQGKPYGRVSVGTIDELKLFVKSITTIV